MKSTVVNNRYFWRRPTNSEENRIKNDENRILFSCIFDTLELIFQKKLKHSQLRRFLRNIFGIFNGCYDKRTLSKGEDPVRENSAGNKKFRSIISSIKIYGLKFCKNSYACNLVIYCPICLLRYPIVEARTPFRKVFTRQGGKACKRKKWAAKMKIETFLIRSIFGLKFWKNRSCSQVYRLFTH